MTPAGGGARARARCRVTVGFFVLAPCDARAAQVCGRCGRLVCDAHVQRLPGDPQITCPECAAAARGAVTDVSDDLWDITFRRSFYWEVANKTGDDTWWTDFDAFDSDAFSTPDEAADVVAETLDGLGDDDGFGDDGGYGDDNDGGYGDGADSFDS
ncbi:MAG: hypothetical protein R2699_06375 [Acidimicrobiales bacterium]